MSGWSGLTFECESHGWWRLGGSSHARRLVDRLHLVHPHTLFCFCYFLARCPAIAVTTFADYNQPYTVREALQGADTCFLLPPRESTQAKRVEVRQLSPLMSVWPACDVMPVISCL